MLKRRPCICRIVAAGTPAKVKRAKESLTGRYLRGRLSIEVPASRGAETIEFDLDGYGAALERVQQSAD